MTHFQPLAFLAACAASAGLTMAAQAGEPQALRSAEATPVRLDTPSGLPVPRFVSLKAEKTYCRSGPTFAHPVRITYQRRGLPVAVIAETRDHWRKVRDPEGDACWIHRAKLSGARTVIVITDDLALRARPEDVAMQKARLGRGLIARLDASRDGWVKLSAGGVRGWTRQSGVWGGGAAAVDAANDAPDDAPEAPAEG